MLVKASQPSPPDLATTTSSPVRARSLHATPLPRAESEPAGSAAATSGRITPETLKGGLRRAKKMAGKCRNVVVMEEKMDREANGVVKTRRDVYFISILFLKFLNINLKYILEAPAGLFWDHLFSK